jgi:hypothetical protein
MKLSHSLCLSLSFALLACDDGERVGNPPPQEYSIAITLVADGIYDPADPNGPVQPTLEQVQREDWGFDDAAIAQWGADANAFFLDRFGVDVDDPALADRISVGDYVVDSRANYRVISMSDRMVSPAGWPTSDASRAIFVLDPAGLELGGEFEGVVAPVGSALTFGRYVIHPDEGEPIHIDFQSANYMPITNVGTGVAHCELFSDTLGVGEAFVGFHFTQLPDGRFSSDYRNVHLFER